MVDNSIDKALRAILKSKQLTFPHTAFGTIHMTSHFEPLLPEERRKFTIWLALLLKRAMVMVERKGRWERFVT